MVKSFRNDLSVRNSDLVPALHLLVEKLKFREEVEAASGHTVRGDGAEISPASHTLSASRTQGR